MRLPAVALIAAVLAGAPARALETSLLGEPLRLDFTESLYLNANLDPGNGNPSWANYGALLSRLNVQATVRKFRFGARLDSTFYVDVPELGEQLNKANCGEKCTPGTVRARDLEGRFRQTPFDPRRVFEKVFVGYAGRELEATAGDFYANFGRGLVLSIRKLDELGVDTTLFGGKVAWRRGDFAVTALGGLTNIQNIDEASATFTPDPDDLIAGLRAEYRLFDKVIVGAHGAGGVPSANSSTLSKERDRHVRWGFTLDAPRPLPWLALYGEFAKSDDFVSDSADPGTAVHASATLFKGIASWLVEFKDYRNYGVWHSTNDPFGSIAYQQPPTLERVQTQLTTNSNVTAARVRADFRVRPWALLFASTELGRLEPTAHLTERLIDVYAGTQLRWNEGRSHAFPLVGWREERDTTTGHLAERLVALEFDVVQSLGETWAIEGQGLVWLRRKGDEVVPGSGDNEWREGNVYLAVKWIPRFVAAIGYEFTSLAKERLNQHDFFNGTFQWNITSDTSLRLFAGGQRPGLKCVSGLCRVFPAFNGAKVELVVRR